MSDTPKQNDVFAPVDVPLKNPPVAALLAWLWFAERLTGLQALGALVVLVGIWVAQNGSRSNLKSR